jgi:hypothetical protein
VRRWPLAVLLVVGLGFLVMLGQLFHLRFQAGDIYPQYSTLRADPLGAKALYQALGRLVPVRREFRPHLETGEGRNTTLFVLGLADLEERYAADDLKELESFAAAGGRVIISFLPSFSKEAPRWSDRAGGVSPTNSLSSGSRREARRRPRRDWARAEDKRPAAGRLVTMGARWRFQVGRGDVAVNETGVYQPVLARRRAEVPLPEALEWHTAAYFDKPESSWRVIYDREPDRALVMERRMGAGTLVLLSDSYYFSNEALRRHRQPDLLAWLVGANGQVLFDESHHGVQVRPGVATLARHYRLHGFLLALLGLGALFIWRQSVSFLPAPEPAAARPREGHVLGRESAAGFVNLLRRNIRASEVLRVGFAEWKRTCGRALPAATLAQLQAVIDAEGVAPFRERDPAAAYQRCCALLKAKRQPPTSS